MFCDEVAFLQKVLVGVLGSATAHSVLATCYSILRAPWVEPLLKNYEARILALSLIHCAYRWCTGRSLGHRFLERECPVDVAARNSLLCVLVTLIGKHGIP